MQQLPGYFGGEQPSLFHTFLANLIGTNDHAKGQLISKANFEVFI
jgi:hypothetical protein